MEIPVHPSENTDQNFTDWNMRKVPVVTPVPPASRRLRQGLGPAAEGDGGEVALRLNRSLAEAFSCLQQLQQQCWLSHRWETQMNGNEKTPRTGQRG